MRDISFQLEHCTLAGLCEGKEGSPVVLALHGWLDNAASFKPIAQYWQEFFPGTQLIAIDLPGHGLSSHKSVDAYYHFVDWLDVLLELFEQQGWQQIDIIGHSMGGMIASAFAAAFPEKIAKLCLIEAIGFVTGNSDETAHQLRKGILSRRQLATKQKAKHISLSSAIAARMSVSDLGFDQAKLLVERGLQAEHDGMSWRSDAKLRLTTPIRITLDQAKNIFQAIECPVQLIRGHQGFDMVKNGESVYGSLISQFSSISIDGGHHPHMEFPQQVLTEIAVFLAD
jgi:pimeloyl-ACP methyl ester carboxylesterase